jgi:hypothetical protein
MKNKFFTLNREVKTLDYLIADSDSAFEYVIVSRKAARLSSPLRGRPIAIVCWAERTFARRVKILQLTSGGSPSGLLRHLWFLAMTP